jgi:hypothetical protein
MKKELVVVFAFAVFVFVFGLTSVSSAVCNLDVSLINQDPYPANPGDYVKLVFQVEGVSNPECGTIYFELLEQYPLRFDPNFNPLYIIQGGVYEKDYSSFFIAPYKVRIDDDALNGDNPVEVQSKYGANKIFESKQFSINIEDTRADFEVHIKDYDAATKTITFEILNIANVDIEALTVEIPEQENIIVKNSKYNIVGDLDSNDYTTADFQATPSEGDITLILSYTDTINVRRTVEEVVLFEPEYFQGRVEDQNSKGIGGYLIWIVIAVVIIWYFWRRHKRKRAAKARRRKD